MSVASEAARDSDEVVKILGDCPDFSIHWQEAWLVDGSVLAARRSFLGRGLASGCDVDCDAHVFLLKILGSAVSPNVVGQWEAPPLSDFGKYSVHSPSQRLTLLTADCWG